MDYQEALDYISSINWKGSVPGLERIRELMGLMGNPQDSLRFIHVGGTNGKGSVCAFLSSILEQAGYRVGLFTSPYIEVFNERMQINNRNISDEELAEITTYVRPFADSMDDAPTEFELNTAIAFEYFSRNKCDVVVLEVGMGGALDSTNIIRTPDLAILTAISLDHMQYLGNTVEEIAATKCGIIKPGGRVVLYRQSNEVMNVVRSECKKKNAELCISEPDKVEIQSVTVERQMLYHPDFGQMGIVLLGKYQVQNAAVAIKAVEVLRSTGYHITNGAVIRGFEATRWPGRFERLSRNPVFIVDGAHNPQGIEAAAEGLRSLFSDDRIIFIFGVLADKDYRTMINSVIPLEKEIFTVTPDSPRALSSAELAEAITARGGHAKACDSLEEAIRCALDMAGGSGVICALGSLYMIGELKTIYRQMTE